MSVNHRYASCCLEVITRLANQWGIMLPEGTANLAPFHSPGLNQAVPNMSLFFTHATLSNESIDTLVAPTTNLRHDSGGIFEPSFAPYNMPILPTPNQSVMNSTPRQQPQQQQHQHQQHNMQNTSITNTPNPTQSNMWSSFSNQQMSTPMQLHMPTQDYQMMNVDHQGSYTYQGYQPSS
jgi:hypothetical protein